MQDLDRPFIRRNYILGVANGALFHMASSGMLHATIVMPPFLYQLAGRGGVSAGWTKVMVGLVTALTGVGWLWPQIIFSNIIEPFERKKPFYVVSGLLRMGVFAALPLGVFFLAVPHPLILYWLIALSFFLYSSFGGIGLLPFMDIVSKSMPADMRGRFFGARAFWGSGLAVAGGFFVKWMLNPKTGPGYPMNYLAIFSTGWALIALASFVFFMAIEPPGRPRHVKITLLQQFRRAPKLLRRDRDFFRLFVTRTLLGLPAVAAPFYVLYAETKMNVGREDAGIFIACEVLSSALAAFFAGRIGDKFGNKVLLIIGATFCFFTPVLALGARMASGGATMVLGRHLDVWIFCGVFAFGGLALSATTIAGLNYLLDIAPERRRPTYLGIMYTAMAPLTFVPVLGGALVEWTSYEFVFGLAGLCAFLAILSAWRLNEPRGKAAAATADFLGVPLFRPVRWIADKLTPRA